MNIGVRAHDFPKQSPEALAAEIKSAGFSAVQLAPYKALDIPEDQMLQSDTIDRIREAFSNAGLAISVLGCYVEPGAKDNDLWRSSLERFRKHIQIAKRMGAACVATETTRFSGSQAEREEAYLRVLAFAKEMAREAERADTYIAIEPVLVHTINTPELAQRLLREVDSPRAGIIFDPVNLLSSDMVDQQEALWQRCINCFGDKVLAMHIKNGRWEGADYIPLPLSEGVMRHESIFRWIRKEKPGLPLLREEEKLPYVQRISPL
jgi:sugar phosphate isomerase/epimerase